MAIIELNLSKLFLLLTKYPGNAKQLCTVRSNLLGVREDELEVKYRGRSCLLRGKKFFICNFEVKAIVALAEMGFELWFGGKKFSGNHEPIKVTWDVAGAQLGNNPQVVDFVRA